MPRLIIDGFEIDGQLRVVPTMDSETTEFPVESGADLTDHVRQLPIEVEIEGIVSDTPIGGMKEIRNASQADRGAVPGPELPPDAQKPTALALAHFERIRSRRLPVTIQTATKLYERMAMIAFSPPRDARTGKAMRFTARFKQITVVTNQRSAVKTATPRGQGVGKGGAKPGDKKGGPAQIRWRHGTPPGATQPGGYFTEYLRQQVKPGGGTQLVHITNGQPLTDAEFDNFNKDARRDADEESYKQELANQKPVALPKSVKNFKPDGNVDTARSTPPTLPQQVDTAKTPPNTLPQQAGP